MNNYLLFDGRGFALDGKAADQTLAERLYVKLRLVVRRRDLLPPTIEAPLVSLLGSLLEAAAEIPLENFQQIARASLSTIASSAARLRFSNAVDAWHLELAAEPKLCLPPAPNQPQHDRFSRQGTNWMVSFGGVERFVSDRAGMDALHRLLSTPQPQNPISALELTGDLAPEEVPIDNGTAALQPIFDSAAITAIDNRIEELKLLEQAPENQAIELQEEFRDEKLRLQEERRKATYQGKVKNLGRASPEGRAMDRLMKQLERIYETFKSEGISTLAEHLEMSIKKESYALAYRPGVPSPEWKLDPMP